MRSRISIACSTERPDTGACRRSSTSSGFGLIAVRERIPTARPARCLPNFVQPDNGRVLARVTEGLELVVPGLAEGETQFTVEFEGIRPR